MTKQLRMLILLLMATLTSRARSESTNLELTFSEYGRMRDFVMEQIASAKSRVWLVTDYLTDGDIAAGLFVAKYRKIDTQVLLSQQKSQKYMSRLGNLKSNNIPVYLKPNSFESEFPTTLLIDDRLYSLDSELDFLSKQKVFTMVRGTTPEVYEFARLFALAVDEKNIAKPKDIPLVGRAASPEMVKNLSTDSREAYHYNKTREKKPPDVPDRLPKSLKWDKNPEQGKSQGGQ